MTMKKIPIANLPIIGAGKGEDVIRQIASEEQKVLTIVKNICESKHRVFEQFVTALLCNPGIVHEGRSDSKEVIDNVSAIAQRAMILCEQHFDKVRAEVMADFKVKDKSKE